MINVEIQRLSLDSYAQGPLGAGSWMELVDPPLPGPNSGTLPPFTDFEGHWGSNSQLHSDESIEYDFSSFYDDDDEDESLSNCECGGPPPPVFNIPPPPPLPSPEENFPTEKPMEVLYNGDSNHIEGKGQDYTNRNKLDVSPTKDSYFGDCKDSPPSPEDACPALLIAGDAHVRPRLQPPVAALLVAAVTFAFIIAIAAVVCWRFRKHRNRPGSTKSTSDLTNGVIYDDLPSGPTPRGLTTHGHDTCTLAPMELLDMKLASPIQTSNFEGQNRDPCHLIFSSNPLIPPTAAATLDTNSQMIKNYPQFSSPYDVDSPTKLQRVNFSLYSKNPCPDYLYNNQNPCNAEVVNYSPGNYKEYHDFLRSGYSEPATRATPVKGSQDLYNPTYEEISTGSESTSVSSESSSRKKSIPSPQMLASPTKKIPGSWSPTPCPCVIKNISSQRRGSRNRCNKYNSQNVCGSSYLADEYSDESSTHLYAAVPAPIPPPSLYTIPGTSDGRTSTSSSSDQPPERGREPRYYVGGNLSKLSPATPTESYSSSHNSTPHLHEKLPPLPSRSDRYRIFFTTDRKRAFQNRTQPDTKTLDLASRKRNKNKSFAASHESEPLYHEL